MQFHQATLPNGLTVIAELNPNVYSVSLGFYVRTGARDETPEVSGVSHFLEHMAFKGNEQFTADDINRMFDEIGADYNASTSEEVTTFHAAVLPEYLPQTFELLSAVMTPSLRKEDFDIEKQVILEEIFMYQDQPSWVVYDNLMEYHFKGHPLSQSILGTAESITALTVEQMRQYFADHYQAGNITLAVAGNTSWDEVLKLAEQNCASWPSGSLNRNTVEAQPSGGELVLTRENSLTEYVLSMAPAPAAAHQLCFAAQLLSVVVGDGVSSRMFWDIVDPGHAETCQLGYYDYDGSGAWMTYLSCDPSEVKANRDRIAKIYDDINTNGVTETELQQAKNKVASRVVLGSERPRGRRAALGENWLYRQTYHSVEDDLRTVQDLTTTDMRNLLDAYPLKESSVAAIGPLEHV
ncbi:M16 family metallopeptidase [Thalassoroseus pseudoceratinae]|uniref:M16 family metallopeptidase n=1 Tax=Thalassoroseus pseudoceratinae TaxID=2713176 RepID=UPI00142401A7|nr:pitrilysin family protein [Thalassoroseus pseudoceratinae]